MTTTAQTWTLLGIVGTMAAGILALVGTSLQAFRAQLGSIKDYMDAKFDAVDQRFNAVDQRFNAVDQRFDGVDRRLDNLDRDVQTLFRDRY